MQQSLIIYSPYQFSVFRIYTGGYLFFTFLTALPSSAAIWSNEGLAPKASDNLTYGVFPNILNYYDSPQQIQSFLIILSVLALFFLVGIRRKSAALLLWYGWTCLFNRNNLTLNPSILYIGWLLLACCLIPTGEPWSLSKRNDKWEMPKLIFVGAWALLVLGYFFSGFDKLNSASWAAGSAIKKIIECPLGQPWNEWLIQSVSSSVLHIINWLALSLELACLPLAIFKTTRKWAWTCALLIQIGILVILDIYPIVFGMLTILIFTYPGKNGAINYSRSFLSLSRYFNNRGKTKRSPTIAAITDTIASNPK